MPWTLAISGLFRPPALADGFLQIEHPMQQIRGFVRLHGDNFLSTITA